MEQPSPRNLDTNLQLLKHYGFLGRWNWRRQCRVDDLQGRRCWLWPRCFSIFYRWMRCLLWWGEAGWRRATGFIFILENSEDLVTEVRGYAKNRKKILRGFLYQAYDVSSNRTNCRFDDKFNMVLTWRRNRGKSRTVTKYAETENYPRMNVKTINRHVKIRVARTLYYPKWKDLCG